MKLILEEKVKGENIQEIKEKSLIPNVKYIKMDRYVEIDGYLELRIKGVEQIVEHDFILKVTIPNDRVIQGEVEVRVDSFEANYIKDAWIVKAEVEVKGIKEISN